MAPAQGIPRFSLEFLEVASPSTWQLLLAALILFGIWCAGLITGRLAGPRIDVYLAARPNNIFRGFLGHSAALLRNLVTTIILVSIFQRMAVLDPVRHLMIAAALSLAAAQTVFHLLRGTRLSVLLATIVSTAAFVGMLMATLGSFGSLLDALDVVGIRFGRTRISLLDLTDYLFIVLAIIVAIRIGMAMIRQSLASSTALDLYERTLVQKIANILVTITGLLVGLGLLGIDFAALAIFSGALGLGIGVGLQKIFGNMMAGLSLLLDRSIKPGDVVAIGDTVGRISHIGARAVSVVTRDGRKYLIPNEKLMTETVENWSYTDSNIRLRIPIGIPHGCDIHVASRIILDAARDVDRVLQTPEPACRLRDFGLNALEFELIVWIADPESGLGNVRSEILTRIWDAFKAQGIVLPINQLAVQIREGKGSKPRAGSRAASG